MKNRGIVALCVAVAATSVSPAHAGSCALEIDRAWIEIGARIQARVGAGRSSVQGTIGLLHHQPTPRSIAAAEEKIGDMWVPLEMAVTSLARAREADHANDTSACKLALMEAQRAFIR